MPRASPLKQILRSLRVQELRSLRQRYAPRVTEYSGDKEAFIDRLTRSLSRSIESGELTYGDLIEWYREELTNTGPERVTTRIRHVLDDLEISPNAMYKDSAGVRERWICSEVFQRLIVQFEDQPYTIRQEASFGRSQVDLLVSHDRDERNYIVEAKLAGNYNSRERLLSQLRKYRKKVPELRRTFVLMIATKPRHLPQNKASVKHIIDEAEEERNTEVILKKPADLRG